MDQVAPLLASMAVGMGAASAVGWAARTFGWSEKAAKVATALSVGATFSAQQGGAAYTDVAGAGGGDDAARLAANRTFGINLPGNVLAGFTDMIPGLKDNPLLSSVGTGAVMGGSAKVGSNIVTGQPWSKGALMAAGQGAAIQGGMHLGLGQFHANLAEAVDAANGSELKARAPDQFGEAIKAAAGVGPSLRIPVDEFNYYFSGQGEDPQAIAASLGSTNYAEAHLSGGEVEVPKAGFLSQLDEAHQKALLPHVVDPSTNLTPTQFEQGRQELTDWEASGGTEKLQADMAAAQAETAATPEYAEVKESLRGRYVDAGETPEVAEALATKDANVYTNMARAAGVTPSELLDLYNPKVTVGEAPEVASAPAESAPAPAPTPEIPVEREATPEDNVQRTKVSDIEMDPKRFQFKMNTDAGGVTNLLKGRKWNEDLAGLLSVWKDPEDGKTYAVNGHHRATLAKESGVDSLWTKNIDVPTAEEARAVGALQNIAEGRGTAMDAAKFFRDSGITPERLDGLGISMGEATASKGTALAKLDPSIFDQVVSGKIREGRGVAIGNASADPADQEALLKLIQKAESKGKRVSDDTVEELARMVKGAPQHTETQENLFGMQEMTQNLALEKAEVSSSIREKIATERRTFSGVADAGKAEVLGKVKGQKINAKKNAEIAANAEQAQMLYDHESTRSGPVDDILNSAAKELAQKGANANEIKQRAYTSIREALSKVVPGAAGSGDKPVSKAAQAEASSQQDPLFQRKVSDDRIFPGMESMVAEGDQARADLQQQGMEEQMRSPTGDISKAAGEMERNSPLFHGTGDNPTLFQSQIPEWFHNLPATPAGEDHPTLVTLRERAAATGVPLTAEQDHLARTAIEAAARGDDEVWLSAQEKYQSLRDADPRTAALRAAQAEHSKLYNEAMENPADYKLSARVDAARVRVDAEHAKLAANAVKPASGQPRGWFRTLPDGSFEIGKTKIGDLSTFVHEPAHAYLFMLRDLASREGSSKTLKGDYNKVLHFLDAKEGEPLTTEQHEKWAQANEQYLREGKAPSPGLKGTFQRFAVWLGSVYKKASSLGVELSPEIRDVFDRMYAAEDGVNRAADEAGPQQFKTPEEAGWTEEQFKQHAEDHQTTVAEAKAYILGRLNEAAVRDRSEAWRDEEKNVRQGVTDTVDAQPVYKAIKSLRKGELEDGTPLTLNRAALVEQFGEERVKALQELHRGIYRTEGGTDAETAAEIHGFGSGEEMMKALEAAPRRSEAIDTATRAYMTAKHGDIRYDGTLDDQARLALENDNRAKIEHAELVALKRKVAELQAQKTGQKQGIQSVIEAAPLEAYRQRAEEATQKKSAADLQPMRKLDASRKYQRESLEAFAKGDYAAAAEAKHKGLLNHFLFRAEQQQQDYVTRQFEPFRKRAQGKTVQQNLGKSGPENLPQFNKLMARYEMAFMPRTAPTTMSLAEWANYQYEQMDREPAISDAMYNENRTANYRTIPLSELHQLHDALTNIKTLAYKDLHEVIDGKKIEYDIASKAMQVRARESLRSHPEPLFERNKTAVQTGKGYLQSGEAMMTRMEFLINRLDGGKTGPWHDNLWNLAADAEGKEYGLHAQVTKDAGDSLEKMTPEQRMNMLKKISIEGVTEPTSRHEIISMALNMGNESNLDRLTNSLQDHNFTNRGFDPSLVDKIKDGMLTREEWQFIQDKWDMLKPLGQAQSDLEKSETGLPPVMVTHVPLDVKTADGTMMHLDGGYYPVDMDTRFSKRGAEADAGTRVQNLVEGGYTRATTSRNNMKARTGYGGPLRFDYEQTLTQHVAKVVKDITHRQVIHVLNKLLMDQGIRDTLRETLGPAHEEKFMPWARTLINDKNGSAVQGMKDGSAGLRMLRTNLVKASLSLNPVTTLLQITHATAMFNHVSPREWSSSFVKFLAHPLEISQEIRDASPNEMRFRGDNLDRDYQQSLHNGTSQEGAWKKLGAAGMMPLQFMDHMLSFPFWDAAYQKALKERVDLPENEAHYQAMHIADGAVRTGLGSNAPKDIPAIMRNSDFWKVITTLGGFENLKFNQIDEQIHKAAAPNQGSFAARAGKFTYGSAMAFIIPSVIGAFVQSRRPKEGESWGRWAANRALLFPIETIPLLGQVAKAIETKGDVQFSPIANIATMGVKAGVEALSDKEDKDWTGIGLDALQAAMVSAGVPATAEGFRITHYVRKANAGKIENPNAWDAVVGAPHK